MVKGLQLEASLDSGLRQNDEFEKLRLSTLIKINDLTSSYCPKSTFGALEIAFSFSTVKDGLVL